MEDWRSSSGLCLPFALRIHHDRFLVVLPGRRHLALGPCDLQKDLYPAAVGGHSHHVWHHALTSLYLPCHLCHLSLPYPGPMLCRLVYLLDRSGLHVRALDSHG